VAQYSIGFEMKENTVHTALAEKIDK